MEKRKDVSRAYLEGTMPWQGNLVGIWLWCVQKGQRAHCALDGRHVVRLFGRNRRQVFARVLDGLLKLAPAREFDKLLEP